MKLRPKGKRAPHAANRPPRPPQIGGEHMETPSTPQVSVVIVTYRGVSFISECLDHVAKQTFRDFEVVLVENASGDGTAELVRARYPWVRLVESETNGGFTGGVNLGARHARADLIALLNNDGRPEPEWLEALMRRVPEGAPGDIVSSVVINDGTDEEALHWGWTLNILGRSHRQR